MTYKTFNGGAIVPYGATLPATDITSDGSLFYKTVTTPEGSSGLYFFGLLPDTNVNFGEQPELGWVRSVDDDVGASTLGGYTADEFQLKNAELTALINQAVTGFYVKTGVGTSASRTLVSGSTRLSITNPSGVSGNPILDVVEGNLSLGNIGGTLPVNKGGTGSTSVAAGAIVYSTASTYGISGIGAVGQVLISGGTGAPTWASQSTLAVGSATSASTATNATNATKLAVARTISITGDGTWSTTFDGSANASSALTLAEVATAGTYGSSSLIPVITLDSKGRVTGVSTTSVTSATANSLSTARNIAATGDAAWSVNFNGSENVSSDLVLNTVNANAGTFGSSTLIPQLTVDNKGRVTGVVQVPISTAAIADTANQLTTARTIAATGDAAWSVSFNGASNVSGTLTLTSVNANVGSFGSASAIPVITVDGKGRITAVTTQTSISANTANTATTAGKLTTARNINGTLFDGSADITLPTVNTTGNQSIAGVKTFTVSTRFSSGSESAPGITFGTDSDTGIYQAITGSINFTNNGSPTGSISSSGDLTMVGNITAFSDLNLKEDLIVIPNALDKVSQLTGYTYSRIDTGRRDTGLIAQEVQKVLPEAVIEGEHLSLAYGNMVGLLVEAIKELKAEVNELKSKLQE